MDDQLHTVICQHQLFPTPVIGTSPPWSVKGYIAFWSSPALKLQFGIPTVKKTMTTCLDSWNSYASLVAYVEYTQARRAARCRCWDSSEEEGGPLRSREGEAWFGLTLSDSDGASEGRWRHGSLAKNPSSDDKRLGREHGMCHSVGAAGGSVGRTQASCPESLSLKN